MGLDRNADMIVLADGQELEHGIATDDQTISLGVGFPRGTQQILIGDSQIIPEFGSLAAIVGVAMASIAIISRRRSL